MCSLLLDMSTLSKGVKCGIISYLCNEVIATPFVRVHMSVLAQLQLASSECFQADHSCHTTVKILYFVM